MRRRSTGSKRSTALGKKLPRGRVEFVRLFDRRGMRPVMTDDQLCVGHLHDVRLLDDNRRVVLTAAMALVGDSFKFAFPRLGYRVNRILPLSNFRSRKVLAVEQVRSYLSQFTEILAVHGS